jgi:hypothetical protein
MFQIVAYIDVHHLSNKNQRESINQYMYNNTNQQWRQQETDNNNNNNMVTMAVTAVL